MKKLFYSLLLPLGILLGTMCSCERRYVCYDMKVLPDKPYCDTAYISVYSLMGEYYSGVYRDPLLRLDDIFISEEDSTVTAIPICLYGFLGTRQRIPYLLLWANDSIPDAPHEDYFIPTNVSDFNYHTTSCVSICYDTSNHAISERLESCTILDTVYIRGRLRLWAGQGTDYVINNYPPYYDCFHRFPGIWIDRAEDITEFPKID